MKREMADMIRDRFCKLDDDAVIKAGLTGKLPPLKAKPRKTRQKKDAPPPADDAKAADADAEERSDIELTTSNVDALILDRLTRSKEPLGKTEIALALKLSPQRVQSRLSAMFKEEKVSKHGERRWTKWSANG